MTNREAVALGTSAAPPLPTFCLQDAFDLEHVPKNLSPPTTHTCRMKRCTSCCHSRTPPPISCHSSVQPTFGQILCASSSTVVLHLPSRFISHVVFDQLRHRLGSKTWLRTHRSNSVLCSSHLPIPEDKQSSAWPVLFAGKLHRGFRIWEPPSVYTAPSKDLSTSNGRPHRQPPTSWG